MSELIKSSVDDFVSELQKRIAILNIPATTISRNEDNYNRLSEIIIARLHKPIFELETKDIAVFTFDELSAIFSIIELDKDSVVSYLKEFITNSHDYLGGIDSTTERNAYLERYFESIKKMITDYANEYQSIYSSQVSMTSSKKALYEKYITIFTDAEWQTNFTDFEELQKLMNSFGLSKDTEWRIMQYIAEKNLKLNKLDVSMSNLLAKIDHFSSRYLDGDNEYLSTLKKEFKSSEIDIDLLPNIARETATKYSFDYDITLNTICSMLLSSLLSQYLKSSSMYEKPDQEFISTIDDVCSKFVSEEPTVVKEARKIVADKELEIAKYLEYNSEDVMRYVNMTITDIMSEDVDYETAIELQSYPIILTLITTLEKFSDLQVDTPDYENCCKIIGELIETYNLIMSKKGTVNIGKK